MQQDKQETKRPVVTSLVVRSQKRGKETFHNRHVLRIPD